MGLADAPPGSMVISVPGQASLMILPTIPMPTYQLPVTGPEMRLSFMGSAQAGPLSSEAASAHPNANLMMFLMWRPLEMKGETLRG